MTKTFFTLQRGQFHDHFCEDFLISSQLSKNRQLIAVMDGCSMATESTFASMLFGKLLRRIARDQYYLNAHPNDVGLEENLKLVINELFNGLKVLKNQLGLDTSELLCTFIICLINQKTAAAECLVIGDGVIFHDGKLHDFEQSNRPDYLAYHLGENFEDWYPSLSQKLSITSFRDLTIATDGIFTFQPQQRNGKRKDQSTLIDFLLKDDEGNEQNNFLDRKMRFIATEWNHMVMDDLAMIRVLKLADKQNA